MFVGNIPGLCIHSGMFLGALQGTRDQSNIWFLAFPHGFLAVPGLYGITLECFEETLRDSGMFVGNILGL